MGPETIYRCLKTRPEVTGNDRKWPLFKKGSFWTFQVISDLLFYHRQIVSSPLYDITEARRRGICQIPKKFIKENFFRKNFGKFFFENFFFENFFFDFLKCPIFPNLSSFLVYTGCGSGIRSYKLLFRTLYIPKNVSSAFRMKYWCNIFQISKKHDLTKVQN